MKGMYDLVIYYIIQGYMDNQRIRKGEKSTIIIAIVFSLFMLLQSIKILIENPGLSHPGTFPTIVSIVMVISSCSMIFEMKGFHSAYDKGIKPKESIMSSLKWVFPREVIIMIIAVFAYGIALSRLGFRITTFLYLFILMKWYNAGKLVKILAIAVGFLIGILIVFEAIFKVALP